ncbi:MULTISPECIES: uracil-xanthine permease family protein [Clostridium]|uniref:uracil-xanthine permease family protein n=1 Tax=Clostridium TaxID=1485 RepID=UPI000EA331A1|nr:MULTISPECIES: uracil-xanthine permease family protein [Clostridium]MDC0803435.1 uracil-xanthine permease family protein [Clostridium paraputrificum]MDU4142453.1 uracil-xanthine permease family protein [Clostridium sp.]MDU6520284.1 uracil-xanthine permease family protein [Clostridium sp.]MDU7213743.1 uracil-xanthine permease family protein [Clostridium sp.]RKI50662.1 uracil-xanthine permease [Clostridium paraputrificum]
MSEMILSAIEKSKSRTLKEKVMRCILALQHLVAMFGATVLVPFLTGLDPSVALFTAGCGTLIFHLCTKGKVPVFLGSSFAFIPVIIAVRDAYGDLSYAQGGMFVAGLIYIIVSLIIKKVGVGKIKAILPAQVVGPMIMVIGLNLIPTAIDMASNNWTLAIITLGVTLIIKFFGRGFTKQIAILCGVAVGYIVALIMGEVQTAEIASAAVLSVPSFTLPKFDIGAIMIIAPVVLAVFMEHIGDITTNGQVVGKNFIEDPGLNRTLLGDGLATIAASLFGGPANTTYGENTGVLAVTKNYDPSILRITAVFAIGLAFIAKFGAAIRTVPQAVMGGISLMLFTMIAIVGPKTIKSEKVKFSWNNIIVMVVILFLGLGASYVETKYNIILGIKITEQVAITGLSFAALVGVILNLVLTWISNLIGKNR